MPKKRIIIGMVVLAIAIGFIMVGLIGLRNTANAEVCEKALEATVKQYCIETQCKNPIPQYEINEEGIEIQCGCES